jgi:hypothetical protein
MYVPPDNFKAVNGAHSVSDSLAYTTTRTFALSAAKEPGQSSTMAVSVSVSSLQYILMSSCWVSSSPIWLIERGQTMTTTNWRIFSATWPAAVAWLGKSLLTNRR